MHNNAVREQPLGQRVILGVRGWDTNRVSRLCIGTVARNPRRHRRRGPRKSTPPEDYLTGEIRPTTQVCILDDLVVVAYTFGYLLE